MWGDGEMQGVLCGLAIEVKGRALLRRPATEVSDFDRRVGTHVMRQTQ